MALQKHHIALKVGQQYTHRLKGRGTAGYSWEYTLEGSPALIEISRESGLLPQHLDIQPGSTPPGSASADELVRIQSLAPGNVTLHFAQRRIWEVGRAPLNVEIVDIEIEAA